MKEYSKGIYVKFKPEEVEILHNRMKEAGVQNMSAYVPWADDLRWVQHSNGIHHSKKSQIERSLQLQYAPALRRKKVFFVLHHVGAGDGVAVG